MSNLSRLQLDRLLQPFNIDGTGEVYLEISTADPVKQNTTGVNMDIDIDEGEITLTIRAKRSEYIDLKVALMQWNSGSKDPLFLKLVSALDRIDRGV